MNRLKWKERIASSAMLGSAYALAEGVASHTFSLAGHPYEAARRLLHGWKHLGENGLGKKRAARTLLIIQRNTLRNGALLPVDQNAFHQDFRRSRTARRLREKYHTFPLQHRVRLRYPREDPDPERQGDLVILKSPSMNTPEKGVILAMYHEGIEATAAVFDLGALAKRWQFVLETSNWGAQDGRFLPWIGADLDTIVMAPRADDYSFFERLATNLVPIRLGSGEWVNHTVFLPKPPTEPFLFDVSMVASWNPLKRHQLLFDAIAVLRARGRKLSVCLIGIPGPWKRERIEAMASARGIAEQVTIYEQVPHARVGHIVARSRVSVLLSRQEGSNRSVYESLFCGTPVIVYDEHKGIDLSHVNARTGRLASDHALPDVLASVIECRDSFDPAGYARDELGYVNATRKLNEALKALATAKGLPWERDIVAKCNAPNPRYVEASAYARFSKDYEALADALLPVP